MGYTLLKVMCKYFKFIGLLWGEGGGQSPDVHLSFLFSSSMFVDVSSN